MVLVHDGESEGPLTISIGNSLPRLCSAIELWSGRGRCPLKLILTTSYHRSTRLDLRLFGPKLKGQKRENFTHRISFNEIKKLRVKIIDIRPLLLSKRVFRQHTYDYSIRYVSYIQYNQWIN